jgi:hypothetical protein
MGVNGIVRYLFLCESIIRSPRGHMGLSGRGRTALAGAAVAILMLLFGNILLSSDAELSALPGWDMLCSWCATTFVFWRCR